jgi:phage RecT family recombinase
MTEALAQKQQYQAYVDKMTTQVIAALPISVRDEDLKRARAHMRVAFSADAHGALLECTGESIARAIVLSAITGLMPGGPKPDVWLIPRRNKHKGNALEVNWQLSFRGFIRLARRSGWDLEPVLVFEGERFEIEEGSAPRLLHVVNLDVERSWATLRYGYIRVFREGQRAAAKTAFLNKAQIQQRRNKAQDQNVWNEWPLEMALKTLCNYAGNREMFPLDDPARYAVDASEQAELGAGAGLSIGRGSEEGRALPSGEEGATLDATGSWEPALATTTAEAPQRMREPGEEG